MSITFMQEVLRIADRFVDRKDPDSIDRQGQLNQVLVVVVIFHAIMGISFVKMEEYERKHPRPLPIDINVAFEFSVPPILPEIKLPLLPPPVHLIDGENPTSGSDDAAKARAAKKISIQAINAPETIDLQQRPDPARIPVSRATTEQPPVAVTQMTPIKSEPLPLPASTNNRNESQNPGDNSSTPASGANYEASPPDDSQSNSIGKGGLGDGGSGHDSGTQGAGAGEGFEGSRITRTVQNAQRAMLNIAPYRKKLLLQIGSSWHPKQRAELTVQFEVAKDGTVLSAAIVESSGHSKLDAAAVAFIEGTQFPPLPEAFQGDSLLFEIDMSSLKFMN